MQLPQGLARFNRHVTNPIQRMWAGWLPPFGIVEHVGRRSGKPYRTPVNLFSADVDGKPGVAILLTYGPDRDWLKNLTAAGGGRIRSRGKTFGVADPRVVSKAEAASHLRPGVRGVFARLPRCCSPGRPEPPLVRITGIVERAVRLDAPGRGGPANAVVDFSGHTVSLVAVLTDAVRRGRPVAGVAFDSIGRFAQSGILRDRLIPRVLAAAPDALLDGSGFLDPAAVAACALMLEEAALPVYAAGGYYHPAGGVDALRREMGEYLELGYRAVKMKIGGAALGEDLARVEAVIDVVGDAGRVAVDANGRRPSGGRARWPATACAGSRSRATRWITRCTAR